MKKLVNLNYAQWLQIFAVVGIIILLVWLALSPRPTETKWRALSVELKKGTIGKISAEETKFLDETLRWLAPIAGVDGQFVLNGEPRPGILHVYVTTPAASELTGCNRGNALYDAQLDAIFIDEGIINPSEITRLGESSPGLNLSIDEFSFVPVFTRFILLHELGHRQLHKKSGGAFFDFNNGSRQEEEEADKFAIAKLKIAYSSDLKSGGHRLGKSAAQFIQLDDENLCDTERVWVDLIGAASSMSLAMMFSASDYSSFYEDNAHPNFITRANSILSAGLKAKENGPNLKARAAIYLGYLNRMQSLARFNFAEIQLQDGTQRIAFDKNEMAILSNQGFVYHIPLKNVRNAFSNKHTPIRINQSNVPRIAQFGNPDMASMCKMWGHPNEGIIILQPGHGERSNDLTISKLKDNRLINLDSLCSALRMENNIEPLFREFIPWWKGGTDYDADLFSPPQPSLRTLLRDGHQSKFHVIHEGQMERSINIDTILKQIGSSLKQQVSSVSISTVTDERAYLTVFQNINDHDQLIGTATLDLTTGALDFVSLLNYKNENGNDMTTIKGDKLVIIPGERPRYILFTRNLTRFMTFELFIDKQPKKLSENNFLFDAVLAQHNINQNLMGTFDPYLRDAKFIPPHYAVATFDNDSVYFIDLDSGQITTLFSPGNFLKLSIGKDGLLAFFVHGGRKIYILQTSDIVNFKLDKYETNK